MKLPMKPQHFDVLGALAFIYITGFGLYALPNEGHVPMWSIWFLCFVGVAGLAVDATIVFLFFVKKHVHLHKAKPLTLALAGTSFVVPFVVLNALVASGWEPARDLGVNNVLVALFVLLLLPVGAYVSLRPAFRDRKLYILNIAIATILLAMFLGIGVALAEETYRCDVLGIPNCD